MPEKKRNAFTTMFGGTMGCLIAVGVVVIFLPICCLATCAMIGSEVEEVHDEVKTKTVKPQR